MMVTAVEDKKKEKVSVPAKKLPKKPPGKHCNGLTKQRVGYCKQRAGWGTDHAGQGRCKLHGGSSLKKHGVYSKIIPPKYHELLENIKPAEITDLTHEIIKLKTLLIDITEADNGDESDKIVLDEKGDPIPVSYSTLTITEKLDYVIKIVTAIAKTASIIEANRERAAKREDHMQEFLTFISPLVDTFYGVLDTVVRDERIKRADIPKAHKELMEDEEVWN